MLVYYIDTTSLLKVSSDVPLFDFYMKTYLIRYININFNILLIANVGMLQIQFSLNFMKLLKSGWSYTRENQVHDEKVRKISLI